MEVVLQLDARIVGLDVTVGRVRHVRFRAPGLELDAPHVGELPGRMDTDQRGGSDGILVERLMPASLDAEIPLHPIIREGEQRRQQQRQHGCSLVVWAL
jgi:hypothetical protein